MANFFLLDETQCFVIQNLLSKESSDSPFWSIINTLPKGLNPKKANELFLAEINRSRVYEALDFSAKSLSTLKGTRYYWDR